MPKQPPPTTVPRKLSINIRTTSKMDIAVYAEVVRDSRDKYGIEGGRTTHTTEGDLTDENGKRTIGLQPAVRFNPKTKVVVEVVGLARLHFTTEIQTFYGPGVDPSADSMYGRGTTLADEESGNTSLGFHEFCHRKDFIDYLKKTPLPVFGGKVGMAVKDFGEAGDAWAVAIAAYLAEMEKHTVRQTDEVGYKKSVYDSNGPRP